MRLARVRQATHNDHPDPSDPLYKAVVATALEHWGDVPNLIADRLNLPCQTVVSVLLHSNCRPLHPEGPTPAEHLAVIEARWAERMPRIVRTLQKIARHRAPKCNCGRLAP